MGKERIKLKSTEELRALLGDELYREVIDVVDETRTTKDKPEYKKTWKAQSTKSVSGDKDRER